MQESKRSGQCQSCREQRSREKAASWWLSVTAKSACRKGAGRPAREQLRKLAPKSRCAGAVQDGVRNILHMASALRQATRAQAVVALQQQPAARLLSQPVGAAQCTVSPKVILEHYLSSECS